jgi:hypothetical protein
VFRPCVEAPHQLDGRQDLMGRTHGVPRARHVTGEDRQPRAVLYCSRTESIAASRRASSPCHRSAN